MTAPTTVIPSSHNVSNVYTTTSSTGTSSCITSMPDKNGYVDPLACGANWMYYPSFGAAILFCVLFGLSTVFHVAQGFFFKKKYTWVVIMGAGWEFVSFLVRAMATRKQQNTQLVVIAQIFFLLAPIWVNAFVYMTLGRLIYFFLPTRHVFGIEASSIAKYFVWADVISFVVQATGGTMLSPDNSPDIMSMGLKIYMGGVGLQEAFIIVFTVLGVKFQRNMQKLEADQQRSRIGWKKQIWNIYAVLILITIRIIFRLVEFKRGTEPNSDNPLVKSEAYIYVLDATPMFFAILLLNVFHPGYVLVGPDSEFPRLSRKEKKALKLEKKAKKEEVKRQSARKEHYRYGPE